MAQKTTPSPSAGATITLQVGQCGNQLGQCWFDRLESLVGEEGRVASTYFRVGKDGRKAARGVLIDTEPRAIGAARGCAGRWAYTANRRVCCDAGYRGAANNWACGFLASPEQLEVIGNVVRREMECADRVESFLVVGSGGGGTGSGLGSALATYLRDGLAPSTPALHAIVLPYSHGEVSVGSCNSVLTLAHLTGDEATRGGAVLPLQNDEAHRIASFALRDPRPDFAALNDVFATHLVATLPPVPLRGGGSRRLQGGVAASLAQLCYHPAYRVLSTAVAPIFCREARAFETATWDGVLGELRRDGLSMRPCGGAGAAAEAHIKGSSSSYPRSSSSSSSSSSKATFRRPVDRALRRPAASLANGVSLHGADAEDATALAAAHFGEKGSQYYPAWARDDALAIRPSVRPLRDAERSVALLSNSQMPLPALRHVVDRTKAMFQARAFVHHYEKHGLTFEDLTAALERVERIIEDYDALAPDELPPPPGRREKTSTTPPTKKLAHLAVHSA